MSSAALERLTAESGLASSDGWPSEVFEAAAIRDDLHGVRNPLALAAPSLSTHVEQMLGAMRPAELLADVVIPGPHESTLLELAVVCGQIAAYGLGTHLAGAAGVLHEDLAAVADTSATCPAGVAILLNALVTRTNVLPAYVPLTPGRCTIGEARVWAGLLSATLRRQQDRRANWGSL